MILLADSGSTKTDWCVADGAAEICRIATHGTNPFFQSADEIAREVDGGLLPQLGNRPIEQIRFYGAGCAFPDKIAVIRDVLAARFTAADIEVGSDMLAAARALCGRNAGIACILGTGSNSCLYDGTEITANVSPLGFILGDEGSGAVLGRTLVGDCLKNQLPTGLREKFLSRFGLTPADILEQIYKKPVPNRFLAGLSPFLAENLDVPEIRALVKNGFASFLRRNVLQYPDCRELPVHFTGSVAYYYKEILEETAVESGLRIGSIVRTPMEGLVRYHANQ